MKIKPGKDRICPTCNNKVHGKKSKRYCSDKCKSVHHKIAKIQTQHIQHIRNKNAVRNYVICEGIMSVNCNYIKIHRDMLFKFGFDIHAYTNQSKRHGITYYHIHDYTFKIHVNGIVEVWRVAKDKHYFKEFLDRWLLEFPKGIRITLQRNARGMVENFERFANNNENLFTVTPFLLKGISPISPPNPN